MADPRFIDADSHVMEVEETWACLDPEYAGRRRQADMPHLESRENVVAEIRERADVSDAVKAKLLGANAAAFYRFSPRG